MLDIWISVTIGLFATTMGFVGLRISLYPPSSPTEKKQHTVFFASLCLLSVVLITIQGFRNWQSQNRLQEDILSAKLESKGAKEETEKIRGELKIESMRRQRAESELSQIIQKTGTDTRIGVAEDFRKSPIKVDVTPQKEPIKISVSLMPRESPGAPPYRTEFLATVNQTVTPIRLLVECTAEIIDANARVVGAGVHLSGGWGGKFSANQYGIGITSPAWTSSNGLLITVRSHQKDTGACKFSLQ